MIANTELPTMVLENINADVASNYLDQAGANREVRPFVVDQYARDMERGRWYTSVIRFGEDGQLIDGQHRLWAVVKSEKTIPFWVERGVPAEAIPAIDTGIKRTVGDFLAMRGEISARVLAGATRLVRHLTLYPGKVPSGQSRYSPSTGEVLEFLESHGGIRESIAVGRRSGKAILMAPSVATGLHYLERQRNPEKADSFWYQIETGVDLANDTGPHAFREAIIANNIRHSRERMTQNETVALAIKAYNYWEADRPLRRLMWFKNEAFPILGRIAR